MLEVKDYYELNGWTMDGETLVSNVKVYNLGNAVRGGKFPMALDTTKMTNEIKPITLALGNAKPASGHDCLLKGIQVVFDLKWTVKASVELQRYHFIDFVSSQSTMHCISKMDIRNMCNKYVTEATIKEVERLKDMYLTTESKEDYLRLLYNIPSGFELTAGMSTNYQQLKTIYQQRRTHRLPDWQMFCDWIETLPHSELITQKFSEN